MFTIQKIRAAFAIAAEDAFSRDTPSRDRQAYLTFRKLGKAMQKLESLSPPQFSTWNHPHESQKQFLDWTISDIVRDELASHRLNHGNDLLGMPLTIDMLAEGALGSEATYRAWQHSWPAKVYVSKLLENLDNVDALADTFSKMDETTIQSYIAKNREKYTSYGCTPIDKKPTAARRFGDLKL